MAGVVVYEGYAKFPQYRVEYGHHGRKTWSCRGDSYSSLKDAKREASRHEARGYDTRIVQVGKEISR